MTYYLKYVVILILPSVMTIRRFYTFERVDEYNPSPTIHDVRIFTYLVEFSMIYLFKIKDNLKIQSNIPLFGIRNFLKYLLIHSVTKKKKLLRKFVNYP